MAKNRVPVPDDTEAKLMFGSDRTCCICQERGKYIQIHHIDENPSNNSIENLADLCLDCHNDTQLRGGFGNKLDASQVKTYRDDWLKRVQKRRDDADVTAATRSVYSSANPTLQFLSDEQKLINYINTLPVIRKDIYTRAHQKWDTGVTYTMKEGTQDVIDVLELILRTLASWYPSGHFGDDTQDYFNSLIATRYSWRRAHSEPLGRGTGGTTVGVIVGGKVTEDIENMVANLVFSLYIDIEGYDSNSWQKAWCASYD